MFCPNCRDEFREGFTHCGKCDVDLVDSLDDVPQAPEAVEQSLPVSPLRLVDYCGFFSLDDARHARDQLRVPRIRSEIVLREPPGTDWDAPAQEEYWIRIDRDRIKEAVAILDTEADSGSRSDDSHFSCSECGHSVANEETFCPDCGARFEDD